MHRELQHSILAGISFLLCLTLLLLMLSHYSHGKVTSRPEAKRQSVQKETNPAHVLVDEQGAIVGMDDDGNIIWIKDVTPEQALKRILKSKGCL